MSYTYRYKPLMSRHGKSKLSDTEEQAKKISENIYDYDGMISSQKQRGIKTYTMQPASLSTELNYLKITDWSQKAKCKDKTSLFFRHSCTPKCNTHPSKCERVKSVRDCKEICAYCPVLHYCREWAIQENLEVGVAGGMTEYERLVFIEERLGEIDDGNTF